MNLILCGFKHSGKTYFGERLAERLSLPFIDTDRLIEQQDGRSCAAIYRAEGEAYFRALEEKIVLSLTPSRSMIALGGGTPLNPRLLPHLKTLGTLVVLSIDKALLKARFLAFAAPAFLEAATFEEMVAAREPLYKSLLAHTIDVSGKTDEEVLTELEKIWGQTPPAYETSRFIDCGSGSIV